MTQRPDFQEPPPPPAPRSRWFRNLPGLFITFLFLATLLLWFLSHRGRDCLAGVSIAGRLQLAGTCHSALGLGFTNIRMGGSFYDGAQPSSDEVANLRKHVEDNAAKGSQRWGFAFYAAAGKDANAFGIPGAKYLALFMPLWFVATLTGLLSLLWARGVFHRWRWSRTGHCINCGYDLRQSDGRCPECGLGIRKISQPADAKAS